MASNLRIIDNYLFDEEILDSFGFFNYKTFAEYERDIDECLLAYEAYIINFYTSHAPSDTPVDFEEFYICEWQDSIIREHYLNLSKIN